MFSLAFSDSEIRLLVAALLGALIGLERELQNKSPSLRTFTLISLGSALFSIVSQKVTDTAHSGDPSRIAAQIVTGIGFIGAGAIFKSHRGISGLTTAALMWAAAGVGMACGFGFYEEALFAAVIALIMMLSLNFVHSAMDKARGRHTPGRKGKVVISPTDDDL